MIVTMLGREVPDNDAEAFDGDHVLALLLEAYPKPLSIDELRTELSMKDMPFVYLRGTLIRAGLIEYGDGEHVKLTYLGHLIAGIGHKVANPD